MGHRERHETKIVFLGSRVGGRCVFLVIEDFFHFSVVILGRILLSLYWCLGYKWLKIVEVWQLQFLFLMALMILRRILLGYLNALTATGHILLR